MLERRQELFWQLHGYVVQRRDLLQRNELRAQEDQRNVHERRRMLQRLLHRWHVLQRSLQRSMRDMLDGDMQREHVPAHPLWWEREVRWRLREQQSNELHLPRQHDDLPGRWMLLQRLSTQRRLQWQWDVLGSRNTGMQLRLQHDWMYRQLQARGRQSMQCQWSSPTVRHRRLVARPQRLPCRQTMHRSWLVHLFFRNRL